MLALIDETTESLFATVEPLTDADVAAASVLPGWTRGHVLTHIARNADALRNLLIWAGTGVETPAYASAEAREAAIEAGAPRPAAEQFADLLRTAAAFRAEAETMPERGWHATLSAFGTDIPAMEILTRRLTEVVLHHTDLDRGYTQDQWPAAFATLDLPGPLAAFRATR